MAFLWLGCGNHLDLVCKHTHWECVQLFPTPPILRTRNLGFQELSPPSPPCVCRRSHFKSTAQSCRQNRLLMIVTWWGSGVTRVVLLPLLPISLLNPHKKFVVGRKRGRDGEKTARAFSLRLSLASTPAANWASSPSPHYVCLLSHFSHICFCVTPWTAARQASQLMGFSRTGE